MFTPPTAEQVESARIRRAQRISHEAMHSSILVGSILAITARQIREFRYDFEEARPIVEVVERMLADHKTTTAQIWRTLRDLIEGDSGWGGSQEAS